MYEITHVPDPRAVPATVAEQGRHGAQPGGGSHLRQRLVMRPDGPEGQRARWSVGIAEGASVAQASSMRKASCEGLPGSAAYVIKA